MKRSDGTTVDGCGMFCGTVFDGSAMGTLMSKVSSTEDSLLDAEEVAWPLNDEEVIC